MKITIAPKESYNIEMPVEMSIDELKIFIKKMNRVLSVIDGVPSRSGDIKARGREEIVEVLKAFHAFKQHTPEMDEALKKCNLSWSTVNLYKSRWVDKFQIKPEEILKQN